MDSLASIFEAWAGLADASPELPIAEVPLEPLRRMVQAANKDASSAGWRLQGLIERSSSTFFPGVGDPLNPSLEIASCRWLARDREESYSDWLAWIIEHQDDPKRVLKLFGLRGTFEKKERWTVDREFITPQGRLDLLLRHDQFGVLCVEVKTDAAAGRDQLERYIEWLSRQRSTFRLILLAIDPPDDEQLPQACHFCSWKNVAQGLRTWAREWLDAEKTYTATLTLAFCSAVERNLLRLGGGGLNTLRTADYLDEVFDAQEIQSTI